MFNLIFERMLLNLLKLYFLKQIKTLVKLFHPLFYIVHIK